MVRPRATPHDLPDWLRDHMGRHHPVAAAATVRDGRIATGTLKAPADGDFELGSIAKALTGQLYVDAVGRGEVTGDTTLGELLPLDGVPTAAITLASLATHSSGLPRIPGSMQPLQRTRRLWVGGKNPYPDSVDDLLEHARRVTVGEPKPSYSNFGFQLLGLALARRAGCTFPTLLRRRLVTPLKLTGMYVPTSTAELRETAVDGVGRYGLPREPWVGEALGPAGGVRATPQDLGMLIHALLDGSAPGVGALDPVVPFGRGGSIGAGWMTLHHRGRALVWHNGGTGGFRSWIGLDRERGVGAAVLSASSRSVDGHGFVLLSELAAADPAP